MPGIASGKTTCRKVCQRVAPSVADASSYECEIARIELDIGSTASGNAVWINPRSTPFSRYRPRTPHRRMVPDPCRSKHYEPAVALQQQIDQQRQQHARKQKPPRETRLRARQRERDGNRKHDRADHALERELQR